MLIEQTRSLSEPGYFRSSPQGVVKKNPKPIKWAGSHLLRKNIAIIENNFWRAKKVFFQKNWPMDIERITPPKLRRRNLSGKIISCEIWILLADRLKMLKKLIFINKNEFPGSNSNKVFKCSI